MSEELGDSPFLGKRTINFISSILRTSSVSNSSGAGMTPVSHFEKKLLENQEKVREVNEGVNNELIELLRSAQDYIPPHTAMKLLLYSHERNFLTKAYQIVFFAGRDRTVLARDEINYIIGEIKRDPETEVGWLMAMYAAEEKEEIVPKSTNLNLPADFQ